MDEQNNKQKQKYTLVTKKADAFYGFGSFFLLLKGWAFKIFKKKESMSICT